MRSRNRPTGLLHPEETVKVLFSVLRDQFASMLVASGATRPDNRATDQVMKCKFLDRSTPHRLAGAKWLVANMRLRLHEN
jgi:hypothetical protein